jgi:hypothetical protein
MSFSTVTKPHMKNTVVTIAIAAAFVFAGPVLAV